MTIDANTKAAIRERLSFYRELGIGPLYRRDVAAGLQAPGDPELASAEADDEGLLVKSRSRREEEQFQRPTPAKTTWAEHPATTKGSFDSGGQRRAAYAQDDTAKEVPSDDGREAKLRVILDDIGPNCQRCKLAKLGRKQIVFGTGDPNAELMFIGEGPGADEDEQGLPFVGRAGQLLNNMINAMGLKREQVYIANIVKCRPPGNRTPERDECDTCSPFLMRQIRAVRP